MRVRLGALSVALQSEAPALLEAWAQLFAGWETSAPPDLRLSLAVREQLPSLPASPPCFRDERGIVDVYREGGAFVLHFHDGALLHLGSAEVTGAVQPAVLRSGRLEDVTFTALAPLLRRRRYFLVHAFAAARDGEAVLLCGQSGSGKTTSGLSLLLAGWQLLANDAVLLEQRGEKVYALPTPGPVQVRSPSLHLLPALRHRPGYADPDTRTYIFPAKTVSEDGWSQPAPIHKLFFPQITPESSASRLAPLPQAVALAHLLEESVDRWDGESLLAHTALLEAIVQQADSYRLLLGSNVEALPRLVAAGT